MAVWSGVERCVACGMMSRVDDNPVQDSFGDALNHLETSSHFPRPRREWHKDKVNSLACLVGLRSPACLLVGDVENVQFRSLLDSVSCKVALWSEKAWELDS